MPNGNRDEEMQNQICSFIAPWLSSCLFLLPNAAKAKAEDLLHVFVRYTQRTLAPWLQVK